MDAFPVLETERLVLREFQLSDAPAVFDIFSRDVVTNNLAAKTMQSIEEAERLIKARMNLFKNEQGMRWGITSKGGNDVVLGSCGYYAANRMFHIIEIGFELHPAYWRRGIMTEALSAIIDFGFSDRFFFRLNRIEAITYPENEASIALLNKLGFVEEGIKREYGYWQGRYHDLRSLALLRRDWENHS